MQTNDAPFVVSVPPRRPFPWKPILQVVLDWVIGLALLLNVSALVKPFFPHPWWLCRTDHYTFRDGFHQPGRLVRWAWKTSSTNPGVRKVILDWTRSDVTVRYYEHEDAPPLVVPWGELGYKAPDSKTSRITRRLRGHASDTPAGLIIPEYAGQLAMLAYGLWRFRSLTGARRAMPPLRGSLPMAATLGLCAGFMARVWINLGIWRFMHHLFPAHGTEGLTSLDYVWGYPGWAIAAEGILMIVLGPLSEEILARGIVFGRLQCARQVRLAYLLSSLVWAAGHRDAVGFVPLCVAGLVLALLYHRCRSLVAPVVAHMVLNGISFFMMMAALGRHP